MAGDPAFTSLLLAMGLRSFSMHPARVAAIKHRVLRADAGRLASALHHVLEDEDPQRAAARHFESSGTPAVS
jgi:phosphotransferase system enzyme I (PtsI)